MSEVRVGDSPRQKTTHGVFEPERKFHAVEGSVDVVVVNRVESFFVVGKKDVQAFLVVQALKEIFVEPTEMVNHLAVW